MDSELAVAIELISKGYLRAAGAVAGVTLEAHLSSVSSERGVKSRKKQPAISDYNDLLKKAGNIDVPTWRLIQRLADIRNMCVHAKDRDPTEDELVDLVDGVRKIISTVF